MAGEQHDVAAIAQHATAAETLDTYSHL